MRPGGSELGGSGAERRQRGKLGGKELAGGESWEVQSQEAMEWREAKGGNWGVKSQPGGSRPGGSEPGGRGGEKLWEESWVAEVEASQEIKEQSGG